MLCNNNIRLGKIFEMWHIVYFPLKKKKCMLPGIKLDMHDIFKCVTYLAPLKCGSRVGGATNRQIRFSKKKMCGQFPIHSVYFRWRKFITEKKSLLNFNQQRKGHHSSLKLNLPMYLEVY